MSEKLTRREREIMDVLLKVGEASVEAVRGELADAPSYSTVRTILGRLETKGQVRHREKGLRYVYAPVVSRARARKSAADRLVDVFYGGSLADAVTGLLGASKKSLTEDELNEIERAVQAARKGEGKGGSK